MQEPVRINKYLSEAGVCSRREADRQVEAGNVTIDGVVASMGAKVLPDQTVLFCGKPVKKEEEMILLAFHKPTGIVCTAEKNNVVDYINYPKRIYPIGRLDKDSEGLLLMTNNGDIVNRIMRAGNMHEKEYIVTVNKPVTDSFLRGLAGGVPLVELNATTRKCKVWRIGKRQFGIILTQGLNRQIRRMCEYFGYRVQKLVRVRIMNIELGDLESGKYRDVTPEEFKKLKQLIGHISMDDLPPFLSDCRMMDVTAEYLPVSDVEIEVTDTIPEEESVYLAVYSDDWTATAYTDTYQNRIATFRDVKNEMLYMPVVYRKGNIYPIDRPFIVDRVGEKRFLTADDSTERCVVSYLLPLMTEMSTAVANKDRLPKDIFDRLYSGEARKRPVNGAAYSLFYWNANQWQYIGTEIATNNHIIFPEVPQNALLYLADKDKKFVGRCFTLNKGEMIWW